MRRASITGNRVFFGTIQKVNQNYGWRSSWYKEYPLPFMAKIAKWVWENFGVMI